MKTACGQRRRASAELIPEPIPKARPRSSPWRRRRGSRACRPRSAAARAAPGDRAARRRRRTRPDRDGRSCFRRRALDGAHRRDPRREGLVAGVERADRRTLERAWSVARARPAASSRTTAAAWKPPARSISMRRLLASPAGARITTCSERGFSGIAPRPRDPQSGRPLHRADQRELQPGRIPQRTRSRTLRPRSALASSRSGAQRGPGVARPISWPRPRSRPAVRCRPARASRATASPRRRDLERRSAQQEIARLGSQRDPVRAGGDARRSADVEDEASGR